jgi:hypothetical protein
MTTHTTELSRISGASFETSMLVVVVTILPQ